MVVVGLGDVVCVADRLLVPYSPLATRDYNINYTINLLLWAWNCRRVEC